MDQVESVSSIFDAFPFGGGKLSPIEFGSTSACQILLVVLMHVFERFFVQLCLSEFNRWVKTGLCKAQSI